MRFIFQLLLSILLLPVNIAGQKNGPVPFSLPLKHLQITSGYGYRLHPVFRQWRMHNGIDLKAQRDSVLSVMNGTVLKTGYDSRLGLYVRISYCKKVECTYGHLSQISVVPGQIVAAGQPIGFTGNTGLTTGEHLHFSIKCGGYFINPLEIFRAMTILRLADPKSK